MMKRIFQTIQPLNLLCVMLCGLLLLSACEDGDVGPQGEQGEKGDAGEKGEPGEEGDDNLVPAGYFEGILSGTRRDGTEFTEPFRYEYARTRYDAIYGESFYFERYATAAIAGPNVYLSLNVEEDEGGVAVTLNYFNVSFYKEITGTSLFAFYGYQYESSAMDIRNYQQDETTGIITFDFTMTLSGDRNATNNTATIGGSFNSGRRVYMGPSGGMGPT